MSSGSVKRQLYVPVLQRRLHAATTLSNCVPVLQRSLHAASYVPVQRHCAIALVPRHFSMLSTFHVQLCALISRSLLCSDVTMLQSSSSEVSTCSSSAEIFFSRPTSAYTHYTLSTFHCAALSICCTVVRFIVWRTRHSLSSFQYIPTFLS